MTKKSSSKRSRRKKQHRRQSRKTIFSYFKGHLFEDVVYKYFEMLGYNVDKNVRVKGFSGTIHEIDVLLEKNGVFGVVEAKNYSRPIPKEWIMKAYGVAKDIGAQEIYVVSASGFTDSARKTAEILGIKLLDLDDMAEDLRRRKETLKLRRFYIEPVYSRNKAKEYSLKFAIKKLFSRIEKPYSTKLLYIPVYLLRIIYEYYEEEGLLFKRVVKRYREAKMIIDACKGALLILEGNELVPIEIRGLTDNEIKLLKIVCEYDESTYKDLLNETRWSRQKLTRLLKSLISKELIDFNEEEKTYACLLPSIGDLDETANYLINEKELKEGFPKQVTVRDPTISISHIKPLIRDLLNASIKESILIYLPVYNVVMKKIKEDSYRNIYLLASIDEPLNVIIE